MTKEETPLLNQFSKPEPEPQRAMDSEISLLEIAALLWDHKKVIGLATALAVLAATAVAHFLPPLYIAEATVLPPQQQQSSLAALAAGAIGGLGSFGLKNAGDVYIGILKSRTIADNIAARFHLKDVYHARRSSDTRSRLAKNTSFMVGKDSLIVISVQDQDAHRAADIANAYLDELHNQNSRLALTDAAQRRLFFEQKLKEEKDALANAEIALKATQQSTGLLAPGGQSQVLISSGAQFRAEIASRTVKLQAMRAFATEDNPEIKILEREISALQEQLRQVETTGSGSKFEVGGSKLPGAAMEYIRNVRELKYHETLFELLAKQYEAARLDEAKQAPVLQVIDQAVVPDRNSRAPGLIIAGSGLAALVLSCVLVFAWNRLGKHARNASPWARSPA